MAKKTYNEKLNHAGDLPKVVDLSDKPEALSRMGGTKMYIAAPLQYNEIMSRIPEGKVITVDRIRAYLSKQAGADTTCPLTAGIFTNICAHASEERKDNPIPWWRTLKTKGELNEKYPLGQKERLELEGHEIVQKGKHYYVANYESKLADLESEA